MCRRFVNFLSRYFVVKGYGVVRMTNAIGQFQDIVDDLDKAGQEIADQRAEMDRKRNALLDQADALEVQMNEASDHMARSFAVCRRVAELIGN